jgi:hypothetical protein
MAWLAWLIVIALTFFTWYKGPKDSPGLVATFVFVGGAFVIGALGLD